MGTRNLTLVQKDNEYKIAQYGQWDGYPEGQGATVLNFLRTANISEFSKAIDALIPLDQAKMDELLAECGAPTEPGFHNADLFNTFQKTYPELNRDIGAGVLRLVADGKVKFTRLQTDFAADSLFCEWAYVIDLDKKTFEVYVGFNQTELADGERFKCLEHLSDGGYQPIKHVRTWTLDTLPVEADFVEEIGRLTNDEEVEV